MRDPVEVWHETIDHLGGWKGIGVLFVVLGIFYGVVSWVISQRHHRIAAIKAQMRNSKKGR
jgi:hypothetical protein